jgi:hypothetical protein
MESDRGYLIIGLAGDAVKEPKVSKVDQGAYALSAGFFHVAMTSMNRCGSLPTIADAF